MGRHSAPDDDDVAAGSGEETAAAVAVDTATSRPRPGRHASAGEADSVGDASAGEAESAGGGEARPRPDAGLTLIEDVLEEPAVEPAAGATDETVRIPIITDPVLDQPVPEADTARFPAVVDEPGTDAAEPAPPSTAATAADAPTGGVAPARPGSGATGSASDLALLRAHPDLLARCIAAVVVPIGVYLVVLAVVGALKVPTALIWCAVPLVVAGVLVGLFLDLAHRKYRTAPAPPDPS